MNRVLTLMVSITCIFAISQECKSTENVCKAARRVEAPHLPFPRPRPNEPRWMVDERSAVTVYTRDEVKEKFFKKSAGDALAARVTGTEAICSGIDAKVDSKVGECERRMRSDVITSINGLSPGVLNAQVAAQLETLRQENLQLRGELDELKARVDALSRRTP